MSPYLQKNISHVDARKLLKSTAKHKYNARKMVIDDKTFDSQKEADYYIYLRTLLKQNKIKSIELQPKFLLQPGFIYQGKKYQAITYTADFKITHNDETIEVVDVKGVKTQVYQIKKKLFLLKYPDVRFTEI